MYIGFCILASRAPCNSMLLQNVSRNKTDLVFDGDVSAVSASSTGSYSISALVQICFEKRHRFFEDVEWFEYSYWILVLNSHWAKPDREAVQVYGQLCTGKCPRSRFQRHAGNGGSGENGGSGGLAAVTFFGFAFAKSRFLAFIHILHSTFYIATVHRNCFWFGSIQEELPCRALDFAVLTLWLKAAFFKMFRKHESFQNVSKFRQLKVARSDCFGPRHAPIRISENSVLLWHRYTATLSQGRWTVEASQLTGAEVKVQLFPYKTNYSHIIIQCNT